MSQALSLVGAAIVLAAFAGLQRGRLTAESPAYQLANMVGAGTLAVAGAIANVWGFVILDVVWMSLAAAKLAALGRARSQQARTS